MFPRLLSQLIRSLLIVLPLSVQAQLNGTYVIDGGGGGDYTTFAAAFNDLETQGVSGPVVIEVTNGFYNGRATLDAIPGVSAANTVTFRGQSLDSSLVTWSAPTTTTVSVFTHNSLLRLNGAQFVTFEHMTLQRTGTAQYGHVVVIDGATSNITIQHCRLRGPTNFTTTHFDRNLIHAVNSAVQAGMVFRNNRMDNGNRSIYWNAPLLEADEVLFEGNLLFRSPAWIQGISGQALVLHNTTETLLSFQGFTLQNLSGVVDFSGNTLKNTTPNATVNLQSVVGTPGTPVRVANNMLMGITALNLSACSYLDLLHNSTSGAANILNGNTAIRMLNNIWYRDAGNALSVGPTVTFVESDHNCYHTNTGSAVSWSGIHATQASLTAATGMDANSLFLDPQFVAPLNDLHIQIGSPCAGTGTSTAGLSDDLDQEARPRPALTEPDIGADETDDYCFSLNGTYVIGPSGAADFPGFTAAVVKMTACGITGPVVFEVEDGLYIEQLVLPPISGNSAVNTITFRGQSLDSAAATLRFNATNLAAGNHLLSFQGMDHVTFEHLGLLRTGASTTNRYSRIVDFPPSADPSQMITFSHIRFIGSMAAPYGLNYSEVLRSTNMNDELEVRLENCRIQYGGPAIEWDCNGMDDRLTVTGCIIQSMYDGIAIRDAAQPFAITGNTITNMANTNNTLRGILVADASTGFDISRNTVQVSRGKGMLLSGASATSIAPGRVMNNMVISTSNATLDAAVELGGTVEHVHLLNNSMCVTVGRAFHFPSGSGTGLRFVNNIAASTSTSFAFLTAATGFSECANNVLFNNGASIASWNGTTCADMAALQGASGLFANSFETDPRFVLLNFDLHLQPGSPCAGIGQVLTEFTDDLDGDARPDPVATAYDIGADETPEACFPLNGTYVIGFSAGTDFLGFTQAVERLMRCGIDGPVVFQVLPGTYTQPIRLPAIAGNSAVNTITFEGQTGDSTDVVLRSLTSSVAADDHVVLMEGADHVTFRSITIQRIGSASSTFYAAAVRFAGTDPSTHARFEHCAITSAGVASPTLHILVRDDCAADQERFDLLNCRLEGGYLGVEVDCSGNAEHIELVGNTITGQVEGIELLGHDGPMARIEANVVQTAGTGPAVVGIAIAGGNSTLEILRNRVTTAGTGLRLLNHISPAGQPSLVASNALVSTAGIPLDLPGVTNNVAILNNTCSGATRALQGLGTGTGLVLRNNILRYSTGTEVMLFSAGRIVDSDRNVYHRATGTTMVVWDGTGHTTITSLNTATGMDANSFIADPCLYDPLTDLRSYSMHVNSGASVEAQVPTDIDGTPRHPATPDIGAYEFVPELWNEQFDVCVSADPAVSDGSGRPIWIYRDRKVIARILENGNTLGTIDSEIYIHTGPVRQSGIGQYYMDRNWRIEPQNPVTGAGVDVRLFYHADEFAALAAADPAVTVTADAGVSQYDGPNENCLLADNTTVGDYFIHFPTPTGMDAEIGPLTQVGWYDATVANFSEFYITTQGLPLPVELISFTGERQDMEHVRLDWSTATETDNAGFEIWRRIEGEASFRRVGWVEGAGNSQQVLEYSFLDPNPTDRVSYYHLRQYDHDGAFEDSPVVAVVGKPSAGAFTLFPNPTEGLVHLAGDVAALQGLEVMDQTGRIVLEPPVAPQVDLSGLPAGTYLVRLVERSGTSQFERLVVR